ncbi:DUF4381 domain-containing protein [Aliikangiella sp. G2MR2-5]|uniref:DUF4381 domain-containing protein n=1 Tax=Aliikangiella sp. G2MR2-5 TaxID=2788943 RepID=UPI0018A9AE63|nr:DUF4381 domain-containing protein [Aliikangiella sp. G2MR2-5]
MNQAENPLNQLRDIHLPEQINQFELAPGWWLIIFLLFCFLGYLVYRQLEKNKIKAKLAPARKEIENLTKSPADYQSVNLLSALLKRVSLLHFERKAVASLSGKKWGEFLNGITPDYQFSERQIEHLTDSNYRPNNSIAIDEWHSMLEIADGIIESIILNGASRTSQSDVVNNAPDGVRS